MVVAVRADREPRRPRGRELLHDVADVLDAMGDRTESVVLGEGRERRRDLLVDRRGEQAERLGARLLRAERRIGIRRERGMQLGSDLPEPPHAVGQPRRVVAERVERQLPTPADRRHQRCHRGEGGTERRPRRLERPLEPRGIPEPRLGQHAQDLELRVRACLEPAVELEHVQLVEHDAAVRLLDAERPDVGAGGGHAGERRQLRGDLGALESIDRLVALAQCDEVVLVRARGESDLDDRERDEAFAHRHADDLGALERAPLRGEPAGILDERDQLLARQRSRVTHRHPLPGEGTSRSPAARR